MTLRRIALAFIVSDSWSVLLFTVGLNAEGNSMSVERIGTLRAGVVMRATLVGLVLSGQRAYTPNWRHDTGTLAGDS